MRTEKRSMGSVKKAVILIVILCIAVLDIVIYWNSHLYHKAVEKTEDVNERIVLLERANRFYCWNDQVYYELGRAYYELFEKGVVSDFESSQSFLERSIENFRRSIKLNPASAFSHFYYAQSLQYMNSMSSGADEDPYAEYKKAALLAGHNSDIYYWVGTKFLERWDRLNEDDKVYITGVLKKILDGQKRDRFLNILSLWEMSIMDYSVMRSMIPENAQLYRQYAKYLGEKSLSSEERQGAFVRAEILDFQRAKEIHISALHDFQVYQMERAASQFKRVLNILRSTKFYQVLSSQEGIGKEEYLDIQKSSLLHLVKCKIEQGAALKECEGELLAYFEVEESVSVFSELESYLKDMGLLDDKLTTRFDDWDTLYFQLYIYYRQNAYRDIIRLGRTLKQVLIAVPPAMRERYIRILCIIGDAFQKDSYMYDAEEFFLKALDVNTKDLEVLIRLEQIYDRLNEAQKKQEVAVRIRRLIAPRVLAIDKTIKRGKGISCSLVFDGRTVQMELDFQIGRNAVGRTKQAPLVSIFFNGRIMWEDYVTESPVSIALETKVGENLLEVWAINKDARLRRISYK